MNADSTFVHYFEPGLAWPPLLLLHGTGEDENALLPLGRDIAPGAALIAPRGKVLEGGSPRFFRRLRVGVFDEDDVRRQAHDLADFVQGIRDAHRLPAPVALGYSHGADIAAAMLLLRPDALAGAILIRAGVPLRKQPMTDLSGHPVLVISGSSDPVVPAEKASRLVKMFISAGAEVEHIALPARHEITPDDVAAAKAFLARIQQSPGPGS